IRPWRCECCGGNFIVSLMFDEAVEGFDGFSVSLPARRYGKETFLAKLKAAAEEGLSELLEIEGEERERWLQRQEEGKAVSALISEIKSEIGLLP
ncbi:unnamed protein product, partial [marine sediment metagenome]